MKLSLQRAVKLTAAANGITMKNHGRVYKFLKLKCRILNNFQELYKDFVIFKDNFFTNTLRVFRGRKIVIHHGDVHKETVNATEMENHKL